MACATADSSASNDTATITTVTSAATDTWAAFQRHAAAGCLLAVMSALHPEFKRFVRVCVREHVLKGMSVRNAMTSARYSEVDRQVTALLDQKLSASADAADFAAYLQFADQNWHKYVAELDFHGDLRAVLRESGEIRNNVVCQAPMTRSEFEHALAVLRRLAEIIAVQLTTKSLIEALVDAADIEVVADASVAASGPEGASSSSVFIAKRKAGSEGVGAHVWVIVLLCWVILALLWTIVVLQDEDVRNPAKAWVPRLSIWDLNLQLMTPEPTPEPPAAWSLLSALKAFMLAPPIPPPTREPEVAAWSWFGWVL
ncbi:hypothetical protein PybrP1_000163 [[Pythium] brassicae (nom. inval.)]|nr:hypothetical protein PybrP1_000163 [[Pythium] brassicae (nom. inval.)]